MRRRVRASTSRVDLKLYKWFWTRKRNQYILALCQCLFAWAALTGFQWLMPFGYSVWYRVFSGFVSFLICLPLVVWWDRKVVPGKNKN